MIKVVVINTDGTSEIKYIENGYLAIQKEVGGTFDIVRTSRGDIWVHDEGIYECEPNPYITIMVAAVNEGEGPYLWGPAVVTGPPDEEGNTISLTDAQANWWALGPSMIQREEGNKEAIEDLRNREWQWAEVHYGRIRT